MKIKTLILALALAAGTAAYGQPSPAARLLEQARTVDVPAETYVYNWRDAVLLESFIRIYRDHPCERASIAAYVSDAMERVAPKAHGNHPNGIASAAGFAFLKEIGAGTPATDAALERVLRQYRAIPRSPEGACSHRPKRVELWDDTVYMLDIALLGCYRATGDIAYLDEFTDELLAHAAALMDPETGLWYHGWAESDVPTDDKCCQYGWNANPLRRNSEFWGRGNGWVAMALADLLESMPQDHPRRRTVVGIFRRMMKTLARRQEGGMWRQLPNRGAEEGNFFEASCTAMFGYAAAKASKIGIKGVPFGRIAAKAYDALERDYLKTDVDGGLFLDGICAGTCIGDRDYYYARRIVGGSETYATGAFLLLANELDKIF